MREIITPVSYEAASSTGSSVLATPTTDDTNDDDDDGGGDRSCSCCCWRRTARESGNQSNRCKQQLDATSRNYGNDNDNDSDRASRPEQPGRRWPRPASAMAARRTCCECHHRRRASSPIERVARKGVPVYPSAATYSSWHRKLTQPRWQPATDGSQYEASPIKPKLVRSAITTTTTATGDKQAEAEHSGEPRSSRADSDSWSATKARASPARGTAGLVRYKKPACSRDQLAQLAKLRPVGKRPARRPEKAEQVEQLIEQLELANDLWNNDEQLLDRAERRDWPQLYHQTYPTGDSRDPHIALQQQQELPETETGQFRRLSDIHQEELEAIGRSHWQLQLATANMRGDNNKPANYWLSRGSSPAGLPDRHQDDQAFRRLNGSRPGSQASSANPDLAARQSYLLCSNAYRQDDDDDHYSDQQEGLQRSELLRSEQDLALQRRLRDDDLHYRHYLRRKPEPQEPPFGIPRQQQQLGGRKVPAASCADATQASGARSYTARPYQQARERPRSESRVSFAASEPEQVQSQHNYRPPPRTITSRANSPDSGLPAGRNSSSIGFGSPYPAASHTKLGPRSIQRCDNDDDDGDDELDFLAYPGESRCESPALEMCRAELVASPTKRWPRMSLDSPRAKSPLLRAARWPRTSIGLDQRQKQNHGDRNNIVQVQSYHERDTLRRKRELKARYQLDSDNSDEPLRDELSELANRRPFVTEYPSTSGESPNESSLERYDYRGTSSSRNDNTPDLGGRWTPKEGVDGALFSIGQYNSLGRTKLKIL